jgi:hypothetical protein
MLKILLKPKVFKQSPTSLPYLHLYICVSYLLQRIL